MGSNTEPLSAAQVRLKLSRLRGGSPRPKLSNRRDDDPRNPFDLETISKEARKAGAELSEITRFQVHHHDLQVEEIMNTTTNTAEPQLAESEDEAYLTREGKKRASWLAQKDRFRLDLEQRQQQSERDRTRETRRSKTLTITLESDLSTHDRISRRAYNKQRRGSRPSSQRSESTATWIEKQKREGSERKRRTQSGEWYNWGSDYPQRRYTRSSSEHTL